MLSYFFFFQAEDGIRDKLVTGVQTCALPISSPPGAVAATSLASVQESSREIANSGSSVGVSPEKMDASFQGLQSLYTVVERSVVELADGIRAWLRGFMAALPIKPDGPVGDRP